MYKQGVDLYSDLLDHAQDASVLWANNDGQLGANITLKECVSSIELQDMLRVQNKEYIQFFEVESVLQVQSLAFRRRS